MPTALVPDGSGTTVLVPNAGENRTAASVRTAPQALLNLNEALRQDFQGSIHDQWDGAIGNPTGALAQALTTSYANFIDASGSETIACLVGDVLKISWRGNIRRDAGGSNPGDVMARMRVSSASLSAVTISENRITLPDHSTDSFGEISLFGTHTCAFAETYTIQIQAMETTSVGSPSHVLWSGVMHIHRVR